MTEIELRADVTAQTPFHVLRQVTRRVPSLLPWLAGLLAIYLIAPLVAGLQQAGTADWSTVDAAALMRACLVSIASATSATLLIALGGIPLGYMLARAPGRAMGLLGFLVQLPLALPPLASGVLLLFLVGYTTPIGRLTGGALTDTFAGIVLAQAFVAAPFLIIAARSAFAAMDPGLEGVAATLGRAPLFVFFRVSLPVARPAIVSGLLLAWLRAFGEFGATVMVAYHPYSLPVYTYVAFGAQGLPAMLPVLIPTLTLAFAIMALSALVASRASERLAGSPAAPLPRIGEQATPTRTETVEAKPTDLALQLKKKLGNFHFEVAWATQARRLAIVGPSGSGKSLTLKMIAGIKRPDSGSISIDGGDISTLEPAARGVAYVPQNYGLFPHLTVMEQLAFPAGADPSLARHWIDRLGLRGLEGRRPEALSLGQQQRVALARALVRPARLILLDEPFSALDAPLRARLRWEMLALQNELAATTILVTHDPAEAAMLADHILVLETGRVLQSGPTDDVFRRPNSETVARLLGAEHTATGVAASADSIAVGGGVVLSVAGVALTAGARVGWSVAPSQVRLTDAGRYSGVIEAVIRGVSGHQLRIRFGDSLVDAAVGFVEPRVAACRFDIDAEAVRIWPI
jgi:ABC-type Fe3+/spermidine/putrescine transport system ATPase subunit/ABC-type sulfate transport system permease component